MVVELYPDVQPIAPVLVMVGKANHGLIQPPFARMMQANEPSSLLSWRTSYALFALSQILIDGIHRKDDVWILSHDVILTHGVSIHHVFET